MDKLDYKKAYRDLYQPKASPSLVEVPPMSFFLVDGMGAPESESYQQAMELLYGLSFTIKMSKLNGGAPEGYFEYVVPPLEGFWWSEGRDTLDFRSPRETWRWLSAIRQPEFVTPEVAQRAMETLKRKKPELPVDRARFQVVSEGLCVQAMHTGPYALEETETLAPMRAYLREQGLYEDYGADRRHHEIYLSDPRRCAPERLRTVLRIPVRR